MISQFKIEIASEKHIIYSDLICTTMLESAIARGTGISKRSPLDIAHKIREGKAVIATDQCGEWAGFCYLEAWENEQFVSNSGLIVAPKFRNYGLAEKIKRKLFKLCQKLFPLAKIFGITTGQAVMKINTKLGYKPVPFAELTKDEKFWAGCASCRNHDILVRTEGKFCLCTGMLFEPKVDAVQNSEGENAGSSRCQGCPSNQAVIANGVV